MKKPIIALTPLVDQEQESVWMLPLIKEMDEIKEVVQRLDGFIITGGHDVDPKLYHEEKKDYCGALCKERDEMEMVLIPEIIKQDKPMMGICRGHQIINVCLGGSLYQDLDKEYKLTEVHRQPASKDIIGCIVNGHMKSKALTVAKPVKRSSIDLNKHTSSRTFFSQ